MIIVGSIDFLGILNFRFVDFLKMCRLSENLDFQIFRFSKTHDLHVDRLPENLDFQMCRRSDHLDFRIPPYPPISTMLNQQPGVRTWCSLASTLHERGEGGCLSYVFRSCFAHLPVAGVRYIRDWCRDRYVVVSITDHNTLAHDEQIVCGLHLRTFLPAFLSSAGGLTSGTFGY